MINLLNKLLTRFGFQLVSTKPIKPDTSLVEATVKFMNTIPKSSLTDVGLLPPYVGDIKYVKERVKGEFPQVSGKTYYEEHFYGVNKKYFNFDGEKYYPEELAEKLKND
jgi:hypothetical protein